MAFLIYDAKVAVALLVFYLFYRFLLKKETFHRFNRVVLVGTAVLSFLLPLCIITIHKPMEMRCRGCGYGCPGAGPARRTESSLVACCAYHPVLGRSGVRPGPGAHLHPVHPPHHPSGRTGPGRRRQPDSRHRAGHRPVQLDEIYRPVPERLGDPARIHPCP